MVRNLLSVPTVPFVSPLSGDAVCLHLNNGFKLNSDGSEIAKTGKRPPGGTAVLPFYVAP